MLVFVLLAGCATTGSGTDETAPTPTVPTRQPAPSSAATIDEHLYVPRLETLPDSGEPQHIHDNVWERLTHRFELPECSDHETSVQWAHWYAERPEYMARIIKRAQPWIHHIADELERRDMPGELALLPIVESAYDPFAYSRGRALGTWQFISATGRRYGLNQNWWYDGRRDVYASTDAALRYLDDMAVMFEGDWLLALAGYNSGEGRVARQVKKNRAAGKPADFWNLKLPRETRGYVPKLLGLTCLFKYPERFDFVLPDTPDRPGAGLATGRRAHRCVVHAQPGLQPLGHLAGRPLPDRAAAGSSRHAAGQPRASRRLGADEVGPGRGAEG
jgi:membrane-bound lytic murein transglycosylase D